MKTNRLCSSKNSFDDSCNHNHVFNTLDKLMQKLDSYRSLPPETVANLHEDLVLQRRYNSNANEGNTLKLKETKVVLDAAHTKQDYEPFLTLSAEVVEAGFKPYWHVLGVKL